MVIRILSLLVKYVVGPIIMGIISIAVVDKVITWCCKPESYKIYVIGNLRDGASKEISKGIKEKRDQNLKIDDVKIEIQEEDDKGDPRNATEISSKLAKANDTLMVVGHGSSTQTKAALPNYLQANPPVPVILTTETNPDLLPPEVLRDGYCPLFRLSPTDDMQARSAAEYAINAIKESAAFWVVEDTSNSVYSRYLALEFIDKVQQAGKAVLLWSTNLTIPSVETLKALKINCVFFAGSWSNALILIRQIKALSLGGKMPMVILSDASVDQNLIEQGKDDVEGVYLTHPLKAGQYKVHGYGLYGKDAYTIVEELIKDANAGFASIMKKQNKLLYWSKQLLNIHRVSDARFAVRSIMEDAVINQDTFDGTLDDKYIFKPDGTREGAHFHVWQIKDHKFEEIN